MANEKSPRKLFCKRAEITPPGGTLQSRLTIALAGKALVRDRAEPTSPTAFRIVAQHYPVDGGIAGIFTAFERGASAVSVLEDLTAELLTVDQIKAPPGEDGKERQWVDGLLYFYVHGDLVILIQSSAVRAGQFESHLSWLLGTDSQSGTCSVKLANQYGRSALEQLNASHVKDVKVGGPLLHAVSAAPASGSVVADKRIELGGNMLEAVSVLLEGGNGPGFNWAAALDGNIEAWLHVSYKRKTNEDAQRLLDRIAMSLRNAEDLEAVITLNNGQTIAHGELKLSKSCRIESKEGVLLADKAFSAMSVWLKELVDSRQIPV